MSAYLVPANTHRIETMAVNSRFVTTIGCVESAEQAREFLSGIRTELQDASHHVYAFRVGHGNSVTEGMSDDGEPSGTAGPPVLAVLRGSHIGDVIVVVSRYFGGTKLGTGGLVRAYSDAARTALGTLKTEEKIEQQILRIETPYPFYEQIKRLINQYEGSVLETDFTTQVTILAKFPLENIPPLTGDLAELTAGRVTPTTIDDS